MALYCSTCRQAAVPTEAICGNCRSGFVSQLVCGDCGHPVERGLTFCPSCQNKGTLLPVLRPDAQRGSLSPGSSLVPLPPTFGGAPVPMPAVIPPTYSHGRFGVSAEVQLAGQDAEILTLMSHAASLLHGLAVKMNQFAGVTNSTRAVIRGCRDLATSLQEEIEVRRGPQG